MRVIAIALVLALTGPALAEDTPMGFLDRCLDEDFEQGVARELGNLIALAEAPPDEAERSSYRAAAEMNAELHCIATQYDICEAGDDPLGCLRASFARLTERSEALELEYDAQRTAAAAERAGRFFGRTIERQAMLARDWTETDICQPDTINALTTELATTDEQACELLEGNLRFLNLRMLARMVERAETGPPRQ